MNKSSIWLIKKWSRNKERKRVVKGTGNMIRTSQAKYSSASVHFSIGLIIVAGLQESTTYNFYTAKRYFVMHTRGLKSTREAGV